MKTAIVLTAVAVAAVSPLTPLYGVDLEELASEPAVIEAKEMNPVPLAISAEKKGWKEIPGKFQEGYEVTIFKPERECFSFVVLPLPTDSTAVRSLGLTQSLDGYLAWSLCDEVLEVVRHAF